MASFTVEVNTGTDASPNWESIGADFVRVIKRHSRGGHASFTVPDASISDRTKLRLEREVRIQITQDSDSVWFKGVCKDPRVIASAPGSFDLDVRVDELAEKARTVPIDTPKEYPQSVTATSFTQLVANKDTFIDENAPSTVFGSSSVLRVGDTANENKAALIQWDQSSIPGTDVILKAEVLLNAQIVNTKGWRMAARRITESWDETGGSAATWNNQPDKFGPVLAAEVAREMEITMVGHSVDGIDVTDFVRDVHAGTVTNNGLFFFVDPASTAESQAKPTVVEYAAQFDSREATDVSLRPRLRIHHQAPVKITDAIKDLWGEFWSSVTLSGVVDADEFINLQETDPEEEEARGLQYFWNDDLFEATDELVSLLPGYVWHLDTTDGDNIVLRVEKASSALALSIGDSDILYPFEAQPLNTDIVNNVVVAGPRPSEGEPSLPAFGFALDTASESQFGTRLRSFFEPRLESKQLLQQRAEEILAVKAWEFWQIDVETPDLKGTTVRPGRKVTLSISSIGVNDSDFQEDYIIEEIRDVVQDGHWFRNMTLMEFRS